MIKHYFPKMIDIHNYSAANSVQQKLYNWETLNRKVIKRLGYQVHEKKRGKREREKVIKRLGYQVHEKKRRREEGERREGRERGKRERARARVCGKADRR